MRSLIWPLAAILFASVITLAPSEQIEYGQPDNACSALGVYSCEFDVPSFDAGSGTLQSVELISICALAANPTATLTAGPGPMEVVFYPTGQVVCDWTFEILTPTGWRVLLLSQEEMPEVTVTCPPGSTGQPQGNSPVYRTAAVSDTFTTQSLLDLMSSITGPTWRCRVSFNYPEVVRISGNGGVTVDGDISSQGEFAALTAVYQY